MELIQTPEIKTLFEDLDRNGSALVYYPYTTTSSNITLDSHRTALDLAAQELTKVTWTKATYVPGLDLAKTEITPANFFGNAVDLKANTVNLDLIKQPSSQIGVSNYTEAFFNPALGLNDKQLAVTQFTSLNELIFGDLTGLKIYDWDTSFSNYFDAGKEWWGSFAWSVYSPSRNILTVIFASSTD
jgi:hypothetical protein